MLIPLQGLIKKGFCKLLSQKELGDNVQVQAQALISDHEKSNAREYSGM